MEKRTFHTLIKGYHKLGHNVYVHGRISGFMQVLCNGEPLKEYPNRVYYDGSYIFTTICTEDNYMIFKNYVELSYPGLCEFDFKIDE